MAYPHESKYEREDNWGESGNCFGDYNGTKNSNRPKHFCDEVTMASTLTVGGVASFAADASVSGTLTCGSLCASYIDWGCQSNLTSGVYQFPAPAQFIGGDVTIGDDSTSTSRSGGENETASLIVTGNLAVRGRARLREAETTRDLTVGGTLTTSRFVFQGQTVQVRNISVVTDVDFDNETVTKTTITVLSV